MPAGPELHQSVRALPHRRTLHIEIRSFCHGTQDSADSRAQRRTASTSDRRHGGHDAVARIVKTIEVYDDFCHANDHHEEHDFGAFDADGKRVFFKIDYFDSSLTVHSPDPSNPKITRRVITIMLAEEY